MCIWRGWHSSALFLNWEIETESGLAKPRWVAAMPLTIFKGHICPTPRRAIPALGLAPHAEPSTGVTGGSSRGFCQTALLATAFGSIFPAEPEKKHRVWGLLEKELCPDPGEGCQERGWCRSLGSSRFMGMCPPEMGRGCNGVCILESFVQQRDLSVRLYSRQGAHRGGHQGSPASWSCLKEDAQ